MNESETHDGNIGRCARLRSDHQHRAGANPLARDGDAAYLHRKGVQPHGVRFSPKGAVVVPLLDTSGRVHGLQFIHAEKRNGRDKDFWPPGMAKQGHFFHLGPQPTAVLLVAEGYATAASLFEATGWPVVVAFDAGNLQPVAQALAKRYRGVSILVCADDDYLTDGNPGVSHASAAALAVGGAWIAPSFTTDRAGRRVHRLQRPGPPRGAARRAGAGPATWLRIETTRSPRVGRISRTCHR